MAMHRRKTGVADRTSRALAWAAVCTAWLAAPSARAAPAEADGRRAEPPGPLSRKLPADLRKGLEAYYPFDAVRDGKVADAGPKNRLAKVHGAAPANGGRTGKALAFDGTDDHVAVPKLRLKAFSFAAWVRTGLQAGTLNNRRLFLLDGAKHRLAIQANTRGGVDVYFDRQQVNDYTWRFAANEWTHVAVTFDGKTVRIYRNGRLTTAAALAGAALVGTGHLGGTDKDGGRYWSGLMDSAAIYSRTLPASQVRRLYVWAFADVAVGALEPMAAAQRAEVERLIRRLDDNRYRVREEATRALRKRRSRYLPALLRKCSDPKLSPEARARIEEVLAGGRDDLTMVKKLGLLHDPAFLIDLLEVVDPAGRRAILERLRNATGARIGPDPAKWRRWLASPSRARASRTPGGGPVRPPPAAPPR